MIDKTKKNCIKANGASARRRRKHSLTPSPLPERIAKNPGIGPENIFAKLLEVPKENWSFGKGTAQYA
ncbi:MAG: tautomerase family protein [Methylocella sp.]|nr:MAG: hypothetical protein DLM68_02250 [Hyphomicrobiales bacterium]